MTLPPNLNADYARMSDNLNPWRDDPVRTDYRPMLLRPYLRQLSLYDHLLTRMRLTGGTVSDLRRLAQLLEQEFVVELPYVGQERASLTTPARLRGQLHLISQGLRLDIRTGDHGFPTHYLYRTSTDYFGTFTLVLEDLFRSAAFDERTSAWDPVSSTTRYGEVQRVLRLSPFRTAAEEVCRNLPGTFSAPPDTGVFGFFGGTDARPTTDQLLYDAGRLFFDAAWHDDQRLALAACRLLDMPRFRHALELVYLCLGGDLTRLRSIAATARGEALRRFFRNGYNQPAFVALLTLLPNCHGAALSTLRSQAEQSYRRLARYFAKLMTDADCLATFPGSPPLYKLVLANYRRLDALRPLRTPAITAAASNTDARAWELATELLETAEPSR